MSSQATTTTTRKRRIESLVKQINQNVTLSPDVMEFVDILVTNFVKKSLEFAGERAKEDRNSTELRICDLRGFIQDFLQLDMVGFALDDLMDESAVGSKAVINALKLQNVVNKNHLHRLNLKQAAIESEIANLNKKKKKRITREE